MPEIEIERRVQRLDDALAAESRALLCLIRAGYSLEEAERRLEGLFAGELAAPDERRGRERRGL